MVRMSRSGLICEIREIRGEKNCPLFRGLLKISVGSCSVRLALWVAGDARAKVKNAICILPLAVPEPPFGLQPNF